MLYIIFLPWLYNIFLNEYAVISKTLKRFSATGLKRFIKILRVFYDTHTLMGKEKRREGRRRERRKRGRESQRDRAIYQSSTSVETNLSTSSKVGFDQYWIPANITSINYLTC